MPPTVGTPVPLPGELNADPRVRRAAIEFEARERRRNELAQQVAVHKTPEERIQIWERLHELSLPKKPNHPLIRIIARNTELTIEDIRDEQRRRRTPVTKVIAEIPGKPPFP
jgi:chromatin segregation and condensation protein Rec8/ScpA/Scc1 (kleisin family)